MRTARAPEGNNNMKPMLFELVAKGSLRDLQDMIDQLVKETGTYKLGAFMMFQRSERDRLFLTIEKGFRDAEKEIIYRFNKGYDLAVICVVGDKGQVLWESGPGVEVPRAGEYINSVCKAYLDANRAARSAVSG
jgi:hypothetical protein